MPISFILKHNLLEAAFVGPVTGPIHKIIGLGLLGALMRAARIGIERPPLGIGGDIGLFDFSIHVEAVLGISLFHGFVAVEFFFVDIGYFLMTAESTDNRLFLFGLFFGE